MSVTNLALNGYASLLWNITPNVRKVYVSAYDHVLSLHFFYNENPSELEVELSELAATDLISRYPSPFVVDCKRKVIAYPEKFIHEGAHLIYARYEED